VSRGLEPDASELLAKALDLAVGGVALARYAAGHTSDRRLQRTFRHLAASGEHQAQVLRERLAEMTLPADELPSGGRRWWLIAGVAAGLGTAAVAAGGFLVYRLLTAPDDDPLRRAFEWTMNRAAGAPSPQPDKPL
jgi:hypothetical protein